MANSVKWFSRGCDFSDEEGQVSWDFENGVLHIAGSITNNICLEIQEILVASTISSDRENLTIFIDSRGGDLSLALGLASLMIAAEPSLKITTVATGEILSAALLIYLAGHKRLASTFTTGMLHPPTYEASGGVAEHASLVKNVDKLLERVIYFITNRTKLTRAEATLLLRDTTYFDINFLLEKGFTHELLTSMEQFIG